MRHMWRLRTLATQVTLIVWSVLMVDGLISCKTINESTDEKMISPVPLSSDVLILADASMKIYRTVITGQDNSRCVFFPTCSHYASQAIHRYGIRGIIMGIDRLTRCHPPDLGQRPYYPVLEDGTLYDPLD